MSTARDPLVAPSFHLNNIGYDSNIEPYGDWGFYIENTLAFLDEENEFFLNSKKGRLYYKPAPGKNIYMMYMVLGKLEQLIVLSGTYDKPIHDLTFKDFNYALHLESGQKHITMGGIQADAHHPSDPRMIVEYGVIKENAFRQTGQTITSTAAIFVYYTANTQIVHDDLYELPYSGICWGYGWGSYGEGGSPAASTPPSGTTGSSSKPEKERTGLYHDEGSRDYEDREMVIESPYDEWMWRNKRNGSTKGDLTVHDVAVNQPGLTDNKNRGDKFYDLCRRSTYEDLMAKMKSWAYAAGLPVEQRRHRPVSICYGASEK
ncbi:hypothetical protein LY78DRAFT_666087 [Colletotrichum sublineola]|nr:hypothetical protein LY78DRAFT_666087 [Colletotrichum sublineola]